MGKFRFHSGLLADSMATQFEYKDKQDLIHKIKTQYPGWYEDLNEDTIKCEFYGYDRRIDENTHLVSMKYKDSYQVIGMSDSMIGDSSETKQEEVV